MGKVSSAEDFQIISRFEEVRKELLREKYANRLSRPVAFWALPSDRRLPVALLGRCLKDLLASSFDELAATPGIGRKKMSSLVTLLHRATLVEPSKVVLEGDDVTNTNGKDAKSNGQGHFEPDAVSEALWGHWCDTVRTHGLEHEKLGRLVPSLKSLPTVIWEHTLGDFIGHSLEDIRKMKTYGDKRVRVILEVFFIVNDLLGKVGCQYHLGLRIAPRFTIPIEVWVRRFVESETLPGYTEVVNRLATPLVEQVRIDAGGSLCQLALGRLGLEGPIQSVKEQATMLGVTRARVYQLLDECADVMNIRWPEGRCALQRATELAEAKPGSKRTELFRAINSLFYPDRTRELQESEV